MNIEYLPPGDNLEDSLLSRQAQVENAQKSGMTYHIIWRAVTSSFATTYASMRTTSSNL
jgi:hypothetical protein